ncbi:hypothetical protein TYRP_019810 [Tyrophagus putrescentiae]|nr:hypothetical protein TYRP_019810 [Tyrophagus putrescentiae]
MSFPSNLSQIVGQIFSKSSQLLLNFFLRVVAFVVGSSHESVPKVDDLPLDHVFPGLTFQSGRPKAVLGAQVPQNCLTLVDHTFQIRKVWKVQPKGWLYLQPFVPVVVGRSSKGVLDVVEGDAGVAEKVANCTLSQI